jgi:tetratricopeptide (TPR) repeat protein
MAAWNFGHNTDKALLFAHQAVFEYEKRNLDSKSKITIYKAYNILAKAYETKGIIDSSAYYYYLLNDAIEKGDVTDPEYAVAVYSQLALFWLNSNWDINGGYIEPTKLFINRSRAAEARLGDSSRQAYISYMLQGAYYFCVRKYDSARYFYLEFLKQRERIGRSNVTWKAAMYLNVSEAYLEENRNDEAINYVLRTLALKDKLAGNPRYLLLANLFLSRAYYQQKNYLKSVTVFETALNNSGQNNFLGKEVIEGYKIAGASYQALGMPSKAIYYKDTYIQLYDSMMKKDI